MPAASRRQPREHFTNLLYKMSYALDMCNSRVMEWSHSAPLAGRHTARVTIRRVWVYGSYARGALDCGDLDLMIEVEAAPIPGTENEPPLRPEILAKWVPVSELMSTFFGKLADVRAQLGTPEDHPPEMEDTRDTVVWAGDGFDWRAAVARIKPDPNATHFARKTDLLPFRSEQLSMDRDALEAVVEAAAAGLIKWAFIELPDPVPDDTLTQLDNQFLREMSEKAKQTATLAPYLLSFMHQRKRWFGEKRDWDGNRISWGGCKLRLGRPQFSLDEFDRLDTFEIDLAPHISRRGPNGIWSIARGPAHPIVKRLAEKALFVCPFNDHGDVFVDYSSGQWSGYGVELFTSAELALADARDIQIPNPSVLRIQGDELLALLATTDVLSLDRQELALTDLGAKLIDEERQADQEEILAAIIAT